jgi:hypothetical protein
MLKETRFVRQLMTLLLCQNHRHQTVLKQVQNYVVRNHHLKTGQIQGATAMEMAMIMATVMEMEEMGQTEMEMMEEIPVTIMENSLNNFFDWCDSGLRLNGYKDYL